MNHLKLLYYKIIEWINIQTQLIITKAEYRHNNKNIVSKQHIVKYDNIKKKLNTTINLHAISIKNFVDALSSIDIELKSVNKNIVFTLNNYSNYAKKEYKIIEFVNIKNGSVYCFVEATIINLLLEQCTSILEKLDRFLEEQSEEYRECNSNKLIYFRKDMLTIIEVFSQL